VCTNCGAVYMARRWRPAHDPEAFTVRIARHARPTVCSGCASAHDHPPRGYLRITGTFYQAHREDIEHLVANEERRSLNDNPTARIIAWDRSGPGALSLTTTTEHLAERLAYALRRAFNGVVNYGFSHENKVARATWSRD
jgi:hypothetical protein